MDLENRLVVAKGEAGGVGWLGILVLIDTNYCLWNGLAMRSFSVALGTMSGHLWWSMIMCEIEYIHVCVTGSPCYTVGKKNCIGEITIKIIVVKWKNKFKKGEKLKARAIRGVVSNNLW